MTTRWTIRLAAAAEQDFQEILRWTTANFGRGQAKTYATTLSHALRDLAQDPTIPGCRKRDDIGPDIHTLHVARKGRKGRHFIVFRTSAAGKSRFIDVLRLLHDSMDLARHIPDTPDTKISDNSSH